MQKSVRYNEGHALFLSVVARKEGTKRGYLCKKTTENSRWHEKYFALYQNVLFYFENDQSTRPSGIYLLEGCTCERVPAPKVSTAGKETLDKQVCYATWHIFRMGKLLPPIHLGECFRCWRCIRFVKSLWAETVLLKTPCVC